MEPLGKVSRYHLHHFFHNPFLGFSATLLQTKGFVSFLCALCIYFVFSHRLHVTLRSRQHTSVLLQLNTQVQKLLKPVVGSGFLWLVCFVFVSFFKSVLWNCIQSHITGFLSK